MVAEKKGFELINKEKNFTDNEPDVLWFGLKGDKNVISSKELERIQERSREKIRTKLEQERTPKTMGVGKRTGISDRSTEEKIGEASKAREVADTNLVKEPNFTQLESDIRNFHKAKKRGQQSSFSEPMLEQMMAEQYKQAGITPTTQEYYDWLKKIYGKVLPIKERKARYSAIFGEAKYREGDFQKAISSPNTNITEAEKQREIKKAGGYIGIENAEQAIRFVERIITPSGRMALGRLQGGFMDIVAGRGIASDTILHECVHYAEDYLITSEEKAELEKAMPTW